MTRESNPPTPTPDGVSEAASRLARRPTVPLRGAVRASFEFFPAPDEAAADFDDCVDALAVHNPRFVSVTYGAGGTTRERTMSTVERIIARTDLNVAAHLTCVAATKSEVLEIAAEFVSVGVNHIVALRGDLPPEATESDRGFSCAAELVAALRNQHGHKLEISVAAYPEVHPKAQSARSDLEHLKAKFDAGADRAITQFFFDNRTFLRFVDEARSVGIDAPIIPGVMPIVNFARLSNFADRCGATIPQSLVDLFDGLDDIPEVRSLVAATVAAEQCRELVENGINDFHFYTMNRPQLTAATCRILGVASQDRRLASRTQRHAS